MQALSVYNGPRVGDRIWKMVDGARLRRFEDLEAWQKSQDLAVYIYKLSKIFPSEEKFGLTNQLRRAASSVSANIAEGFGRRSQKDKLHFYTIAYGSLLEVKSFLYLSNRLAFLASSQLDLCIERIETSQRLLNGLMSSTRRKTQ